MVDGCRSTSGQGPELGSSEHRTKPSSSIKGWEYTDQVSTLSPSQGLYSMGLVRYYSYFIKYINSSNNITDLNLEGIQFNLHLSKWKGRGVEQCPFLSTQSYSPTHFHYTSLIFTELLTSWATVGSDSVSTSLLYF